MQKKEDDDKLPDLPKPKKAAVDDKFNMTRFSSLIESGELVSEQAEKSLDLKGKFNHEVKLISRNDALYLGYVHLGAPNSQPVKVAFDTGSEFLAVTSSFCDDSSVPSDYSFRKVDKKSGKQVNRTDAQKKNRCLSKGYAFNNSKEFNLIQDYSSTVGYGSAELQGFLTQDNMCLQPFKNEGPQKNETVVTSKYAESLCFPFHFLSLYQATGLEADFDGILGLSPKKNEIHNKKHILWGLKHHNIIERAMVSFSLTQKGMADYPYAMFGGFNSSQIVDGAKGLKTFKNYQTKLGTWALLGQSFSYGDIIETGLESIQYPAILDTGNSELSVPPDIFDGLARNW